MSVEFFQSIMGRKYYESDVPKMCKALEAIAEELKESNRLKRIELGLQKSSDAPTK